MGLRQKAPERLWRGSAASTDPHACGGAPLPIDIAGATCGEYLTVDLHLSVPRLTRRWSFPCPPIAPTFCSSCPISCASIFSAVMALSFIDTPHIDSLCDSGVRYEKACASSPVCVPMRSTLLTGLNAIRTGVLGNGQLSLVAKEPSHFYAVFRFWGMTANTSISKSSSGCESALTTRSVDVGWMPLKCRLSTG